MLIFPQDSIMVVLPGDTMYSFKVEFDEWRHNYPDVTLWYTVADNGSRDNLGATIGVEVRGLNADEEALWILRWGPPLRCHDSESLLPGIQLL